MDPNSRHLRHSLAYCSHVCAPSPRWQVLRGTMFIRSEGWCEMCAEATATQVHHLTYARLGHEEPDDLLAVCRPCHAGITHTPDAPANGLDGYITFKELEEMALGKGDDPLFITFLKHEQDWDRDWDRWEEAGFP